MRTFLAALACIASVPAWAADRSTPLSADTAKLMLSQFVMPGKVFAVGDNRYAVRALAVREKSQVFTVTIKIQPLERIAR